MDAKTQVQTPNQQKNNGCKVFHTAQVLRRCSSGAEDMNM